MSEKRSWPSVDAAMRELCPDYTEERDRVIREALDRAFPSPWPRKQEGNRCRSR